MIRLHRTQSFRLAAAGLIFLAFLPVLKAADDDPVEWLGSYQAAREESRKTGKPIFLEYRCEP